MANCATHPELTAAAYCRTCGKPLCEHCKRDVRGVVYCEECIAARLSGTVPEGAAAPPPHRAGAALNPVLAAVLGFIPGVGAMYNGQFGKGFTHVIIFATLIAATDRADFFGIFIAAFVFYQVIDAYKTAHARLYGEPLPDFLGLNNLFGDSGARSTPAAGNASYTSATGDAGSTQENLDARRKNKAPVGAIVLIGIGVLFLLENAGWLHFFRSFDRIGVPLLLIGVGLWLGFRRWNQAER